MSLLAQYRQARRDEELSRLRRVITLRAMIAHGMSQGEVGKALGISQSAVSQQLRYAPDLLSVHPELLLAAAAPVLTTMAADHGYGRLAVFGSVARGEAGQESDIDLIVDPPAAISSFEFVRFKALIEKVLDREVDLISSGGLTPMVDDDIRRDAVLL